MGEILSAPLPNSMRPETARERIKSFGEYFGLAHLYFAQHAAFPMALTSDLLYRLWANFQRDTSDKKLHIPWIAVADLLLSPLCEEVGYELFEMDVAVRAELLNTLKIHPDFGRRRLHELSYFLLDYVRQQLQSDTPSTRDFAQAQRWTALAYTQPTQAARELADALKSLDRNNRVEQIRMVSLMEALDTLADPLATLEGFAPLLTYARAVGQLARGDVEGARIQLSTVKEAGQIVQATGIRLPDFEQWLGREEPVTPQAQFSRKHFSLSYVNADRTWAEWIAWQLEAAGYSVEFQAWDFRLGSSFALEMEKAASEAEHTIVVLSPDYLTAPFSQAEWEAAFHRDPSDEQGILLPIQVRECEPQLTGQLGSIAYINLVGVNDELEASETLLKSIRRERAQLEALPLYPRNIPRLVSERPPFPNASLLASSQTEKVLNFFYCYAREDESLRNELEVSLSGLKRQYKIRSWHDREIQAGSDWQHEIETHLDQADIILLLVSPAFMESDYCYGVEMKRALERHEAGDARVIPIILRPVEWKHAPFSQLQISPANALPVTQWPARNEAFLDITKHIADVIAELLTPPSQAPVAESASLNSQQSQEKQVLRDPPPQQVAQWSDQPPIDISPRQKSARAGGISGILPPFGIFGKDIVCPRCFRPNRLPKTVDKYLFCRECNFPIPMTYIRDLKEMPPVFVQLFGLTASGKTTFLDMLRMHLYDMDRVWSASGFFAQPVTQLDMDHRVILETQRNQGVLAPSTHRRGRNRNEVYIMALKHMVRWGSRYLVLMDYAGETFDSLVIPVEEVPFLQHTPVTIVLLSLPDLFREGKQVTDVLNSYVMSLENYKVNFSKDLRQLIIVYSKADLLPDLPPEMNDYLSRDTIYAALRDPRQHLRLGEKEMDHYLQWMNYISGVIEQWTRERVPSGPALLQMLRQKRIAYKFTVMSATGHPIVAGSQNLTPTPRRVLDPFFWVLEFYKQNNL